MSIAHKIHKEPVSTKIQENHICMRILSFIQTERNASGTIRRGTSGGHLEKISNVCDI